MIYDIRRKQVMLDSDLANLYQCKNGTKTINQAGKRTFSINILEDKVVCNCLINNIYNLLDG